ncbi:GNAT family N-acetyltransferase [Streptomyces sp. NPDC052396]|uniref:GNAT family N-acetyltransferase n=1 Tax=Streptomyces sp. NPDC052396 TaxID=3365689 RepID=UPI0037D4D8AE
MDPSPVNPLIRYATSADAPVLARIHLASRRAAMPYLPPQTRPLEQVIRWFRTIVLRECRTWVVECGGEIAGYAALAGDVLEQLYLGPEFRRRGLGTLLLDEAKRASPDGLTLHVFARNTEARAFYAHHGFMVLDMDDGSRNMERLPDLRLGWTPRQGR